MKSPLWLFGKKQDLALLFAPVWACWIIAFLLPSGMRDTELSLWVWVVLVIGIDVSHVWSSIFRTYLDREEFANHKQLLVMAPLVCFLAAFGTAAFSIHLFWRCMAYVALYHFIKQQYGFMRIYKAKAGDFRKKWLSDDFIIYFSMLYPVLFWHLSKDRAFSWFVDGDFLSIHGIVSDEVFAITHVIYFSILFWWFLEEVIHCTRARQKLLVGKLLWVSGTAVNWFLGIVYFNSDLIFTMTNIVAHGVPYLALVVVYKTRKQSLVTSSSRSKKWKWPLVILSGTLLLALAEEYLWDLFVYRDHVAFFSSILPCITDQPGLLWQHLAIGALAVPQLTHYILDGFIWKNNERNPYVARVLLE